DAIAKPAEEFPERLAERLAANVPQRDVDRRERQRKHAAGARTSRSVAQFADDRLDPLRVLADAQFAELIDRALQCAGQRAAVKADADPLDALIGAKRQDDHGPDAPLLFERAGERLVFRDIQDLRREAGDFHDVPLTYFSSLRGAERRSNPDQI